MHIPNEMLNGMVCPVSAVLAVAGLGASAMAASKTQSKPDPMRFAAVAALVFAGQMLNFPIQDGTSGHLLGGVLASALLGVPFGVLAIALVVSLQALVFADGGLLVLGANVFNMALLGAGAGGMLQVMLEKRGVQRLLSIAVAGWASIVLAATACSAELVMAGTISAGKVLPAMLGVHALIGLVEAAVSVVIVAALSHQRATTGRWNVVLPSLAAVLSALVLSPFASSSPDGLEWVAAKYEFLKEGAPLFVTPLADYQIAALGGGSLSTSLAGLIGVALTLAVGWAIGKALHLNRSAA